MAPLRFKLDEGLPRDAKEDRVFVTLDLDFADIRAYPPAETPGIIVLRPGSQSIRALLALLEQALRASVNEPVTHRLWVVEPDRIRVRGQ